MNEASIKLTLEDKQILNDLGKVGRGFDQLSGSVQKLENDTGKLGKTAEGASKFIGRFITFEMAKKVFTFADATLRSAKEMEGLSQNVKDVAKSYEEMVDNVSRIGQGITLWTASLVTAKGEAGFIKNLIAETAESWAFMAGMQSKVTAENNLANKLGLTKADAIETANIYRNFVKSMDDAEKSGNMDFWNKANEGASEYNKKLKEIQKALGWEDERLLAFKRGVSFDKVNDPSFMKAFNEINKPSESAKLGTSSSVATDKSGSQKVVDFEQIKSDRLDMLADLQDKDAELTRKKIEEENAYLATHKKIQDEKYAYDLKIAQDIAKTEVDLRNKAIAGQKEELDAVASGFGAVAQLSSSLSALAQVNADKNKQWAETALTISQITATANTAEGITKAYAQGGALGLITGTAVGIAGLAQVAQIEKQKQRLADGGIIRGAQSGDTVEVQANGGEMMLTKSMQMNLLNMAKNGGGAGTSITYAPVIQSSNPQAIRQMLRENKGEFESFIKTAMSNPSFARRGVFA